MLKLNDEQKGMLAATVTYIIFGFSYLFSKMALNITTPIILLCARFSVTFITLNILVLSRIVKINLKGKPLLMPILIGLIQPCLYFVLENYGLQYTTTSFTGIFSSLNPVFTALLGALILRERPCGKQWISILVSITGVLMVSLDGSGGQNTVLGCICLIGAYFLGSFYSLMIRRYSEKFTPFELTYVMFTVGFAFFAILSFCTYRGETIGMLTSALSHADFLIAIAYLGIGSSVLAYFLANYSLAKLPVARSTIFGNLATVVSVLAGVIIMDDKFTWVTALAFVLILLGIFGVNKFKAKE